MTTWDDSAIAAPVSGLHGRALDELGAAICGGDIAQGDSLTLEEIEARCGVSRSVARESVRVLEALGLVASKRRVGVVVRGQEEWNLFDPNVIRWRLASRERGAQLTALVELRAAVEPEAARMAASRAASSEISDVIALAGRLWAAGEQGDAAGFLELDVQFHVRILELSGNPMFARLSAVIGQVLIGRSEHGLGPDRPAQAALQLHLDVASALQRRDGDAAYAVMRTLLASALDEIDAFTADAS